MDFMLSYRVAVADIESVRSETVLVNPDESRDLSIER